MYNTQMVNELLSSFYFETFSFLNEYRWASLYFTFPSQGHGLKASMLAFKIQSKLSSIVRWSPVYCTLVKFDAIINRRAN